MRAFGIFAALAAVSSVFAAPMPTAKSGSIKVRDGSASAPAPAPAPSPAPASVNVTVTVDVSIACIINQIHDKVSDAVDSVSMCTFSLHPY